MLPPDVTLLSHDDDDRVERTYAMLEGQRLPAWPIDAESFLFKDLDALRVWLSQQRPYVLMGGSPTITPDPTTGTYPYQRIVGPRASRTPDGRTSMSVGGFHVIFEDKMQIFLLIQSLGDAIGETLL